MYPLIAYNASYVKFSRPPSTFLVSVLCELIFLWFLPCFIRFLELWSAEMQLKPSRVMAQRPSANVSAGQKEQIRKMLK